jgi:hypothetical protein
MKPFFKLIPILVLSLFMASCAATGPKFTELSSSIPTLPPDTGRIYIYRTTFLGAAVQPEVKLNGEVIGKAVPEGFFYADRMSGDYEVLTSTEVDRRLSLTLNSGQVRYVRLDVSFGFFVGHVFPVLVEDEVGKKEIQECRQVEYKRTEKQIEKKEPGDELQ